MINLVINFCISFSLFPLYRLIDIWAFVPLFIIPASIALIYLYAEMPETRGREIYEIVLALQHRSRTTSVKPKSSGGRGVMETSFNGRNDFDTMTEIDLKD